MSERTVELVDKLISWDKFMKEGKGITDKIKAELQKQAIADMADKKIKQVELYGSGGGKAIITQTDKVDVIYISLLEKTFGGVISELIKSEMTYKVSEPFKRLLAGIFKGEYIRDSVSDVISCLNLEEKQRKLLLKKLKGQFAKDVDTLVKIAGCSTGTAEELAYFVYEAVMFEKIEMLLTAAGYTVGTDEFEDAVKKLKNAIIVEEGIKIGVEYDEDVGGAAEDNIRAGD